jgi:hypothetical protein
MQHQGQCLSRISREEGMQIDSNSEQYTNEHSAIRFNLEPDSNYIIDSDSHWQNEKQQVISIDFRIEIDSNAMGVENTVSHIRMS